MSKYEEAIKQAGEIVLKEYSEKPKEKVVIYVVTNSTAKSNLSGKYSAYLIRNNQPRCIAYDVKVCGCGLDRTFELAYNIFCSAYGYNGVRYQDYLRKENL